MLCALVFLLSFTPLSQALLPRQVNNTTGVSAPTNSGFYAVGYYANWASTHQPRGL